MHLSTLSLLFLAALAAALPQPVSPSHPFTLATHETSNSFADYAFEKCKELGIDPHGKHPDDFTSDDGTGRHFEAGSKYALWVAAQNSEKMRKLERKLGRRKDHGISVTMWTDWNCSRGGYDVYNMDRREGQKIFEPYPNRNKYSISITSGYVDPNYWRIHLKQWRGPGSSDCDELYKYVAGPSGYCFPGFKKPYTCVQLLYQ